MTSTLPTRPAIGFRVDRSAETVLLDCMKCGWRCVGLLRDRDDVVEVGAHHQFMRHQRTDLARSSWRHGPVTG